MTQKHFAQDFKSKIEQLSFKQTFLYLFLLGNTSLGFLKIALLDGVRKLDASVIFWGRLASTILIAFSAFSFYLLFQKNKTLTSPTKEYASMLINLYFFLWLFAFFFLAIISPLTFVGASLYGGLFKGNWGFSIFNSYYQSVIQ